MSRAPVRLARSMLAALFFVAYGLFGLVIGVLVSPFCSRRTARALVRRAYRLFVGAGRLTGLFRVEAPDLRAVRGEIVVMNHLSLIDVVVLLSLLGDSTCVVKAAIRRNPFLRAVVGRIFIFNDEDPAVTRERVCASLAEGTNVVVFPEGTRIPAAASVHPLRRGAARLALAAQAPVRVLHLAVTPPVLAKGQSWHRVGDRTVVYRIESRGVLRPEGADDYRHAVALTHQIGRALFGPGWKSAVPEHES